MSTCPFDASEFEVNCISPAVIELGEDKGDEDFEGKKAVRESTGAASTAVIQHGAGSIYDRKLEERHDDCRCHEDGQSNDEAAIQEGQP
jgi:hypothetical protein